MEYPRWFDHQNEHKAAGFIAHYLVVAVAATCCLAAWGLRRKLECRARQRILVVFMAGMGIIGLSFLFGGIAHEMVSTAPQRQTVTTVATIPVALGVALLAALPFACTGGCSATFWLQLVMLVVAGADAGVELGSMLAKRDGHIGVYMVLLTVAFMRIGLGASVVLAALRRCALGESVLSMGFFAAIASVEASTCNPRTSNTACPFPASFHHIAVHDGIFAASLLLLCLGVLRLARPPAAGCDPSPGDVEVNLWGHEGQRIARGA